MTWSAPPRAFTAALPSNEDAQNLRHARTDNVSDCERTAMNNGILSRNMNDAFIGVDELERLQRAQVALFESWAASAEWSSFHAEHYDWWTFPIRHSSAFGLKYSVFEAEVEALRARPDFVASLRRGSELLLLSWGWSMDQKRYIPAPAPSQRWHGWPIRLHKCGSSLLIFRCQDEFESVYGFAHTLIERGENMMHETFDCSRLFVEHRPTHAQDHE